MPLFKKPEVEDDKKLKPFELITPLLVNTQLIKTSKTGKDAVGWKYPARIRFTHGFWATTVAQFIFSLALIAMFLWSLDFTYTVKSFNCTLPSSQLLNVPGGYRGTCYINGQGFRFVAYLIALVLSFGLACVSVKKLQLCVHFSGPQLLFAKIEQNSPNIVGFLYGPSSDAYFVLRAMEASKKALFFEIKTEAEKEIVNMMIPPKKPAEKGKVEAKPGTSKDGTKADPPVRIVTSKSQVTFDLFDFLGRELFYLDMLRDALRLGSLNEFTNNLKGKVIAHLKVIDEEKKKSTKEIPGLDMVIGEIRSVLEKLPNVTVLEDDVDGDIGNRGGRSTTEINAGSVFHIQNAKFDNCTLAGRVGHLNPSELAERADEEKKGKKKDPSEAEERKEESSNGAVVEEAQHQQIDDNSGSANPSEPAERAYEEKKGKKKDPSEAEERKEESSNGAVVEEAQHQQIDDNSGSANPSEPADVSSSTTGASQTIDLGGN